MSILEKIIGGLRMKRAAAARANAESYGDLVRTVAGGGAVDVEQAEKLLVSSSDEARLRADVARVVDYRAAAALAKGLPALTAAADKATDRLVAVRTEMQQTVARLKLAEAAAGDVRDRAQAEEAAARAALDRVLGAASQQMLDPYRAALEAVADTEGDLAWAEAFKRGTVAPPRATPLAAPARAAWKALAVAGAAVIEAEETLRKETDAPAQGPAPERFVEALAVARAAQAQAQAALLAAAAAVGEEAARAQPKLRAATAKALERVLATDPEVTERAGELASAGSL